ncbi:MAG: heavy metal translocating P-type ATPase [Paracoccaceae bacterium]
MDNAQKTPHSSINIEVTGMTCAGCAGRVEKAVAAQPGVIDAAINLALEKLDVTYDPAQSSAQSLVDAVRMAGYGVREAQAVLTVSKMSCASCAGRVEKALNVLPGVLMAEVNLALESVAVHYIPGQISVGAIAQAATDAGYPAQISRELADDRGADMQAALRRDLRQLVIAAILTIPLIIQMVTMLSGLGFRLPVYLELALATPVQFYIGRRFYQAAWHALRARAGNMDQLVVVGTSAAYFYSLWLVLTLHEAAAGRLYFEASAVVITLILAGKVLEARAKRSASSALRALMALRPDSAVVLRAGTEVEVAISEVLIGDVIIIKPGERLPVDGEIIRGESELDESLITGESMPVLRSKGDNVVAGALNGSGLLRLRAQKIGQDTTLSKTAAMVERAQTGKAPIQKLVDRVSSIFVPVVLVISVLTFVGWLLGGADFEIALTSAIAVLVIACPCALGLATPTALVAGTGVGARHGILIRDIEALERAKSIDTVVFDKTGTLTMGKPKIVEMQSFGMSEDEMLTIAASTQMGSEHPLGVAMVAAGKARKLPLLAPTMFKAKIGAGIAATLDDAQILVGRPAYAAPEAEEKMKNTARLMAEKGQTVVWVVRNGDVLGLIGLADTPRPQSGAAIAALKAKGIRTMLLTGDNAQTAVNIATALGIDEVKSEMCPEDKVAEIKALVANGRHVAMVGDGVNDAPALAVAELGIAMGGGADVALETAGFVLMRPDPMLVVAALDIAKATSGKIRQNLFWAFVYNMIGIPVAALGFLNPALAGAAMAFSSVSVVSNSLLLKRWQPGAGK